MEMEWHDEKEYIKCCELMETFKEHQAKVWEIQQKTLEELNDE